MYHWEQGSGCTAVHTWDEGVLQARDDIRGVGGAGRQQGRAQGSGSPQRKPRHWEELFLLHSQRAGELSGVCVSGNFTRRGAAGIYLWQPGEPRLAQLHLPAAQTLREFRR